MSLIAPPKNTSSMDYALVAASAIGAALLVYAYTGGRLASLDLGPVTFVNFSIAMGGLYGVCGHQCRARARR